MELWDILQVLCADAACRTAWQVESSLSLPAVAVRRLELVVTEGVGLLCYRKAVLFCSAVQICEANLQGYSP